MCAGRKTQYLLRTAAILKESHDSDIPGTIKGLIKMPGVGPKMAFLCMQSGWGRSEGIGTLLLLFVNIQTARGTA